MRERPVAAAKSAVDHASRLAGAGSLRAASSASTPPSIGQRPEGPSFILGPPRATTRFRAYCRKARVWHAGPDDLVSGRKGRSGTVESRAATMATPADAGLFTPCRI